MRLFVLSVWLFVLFGCLFCLVVCLFVYLFCLFVCLFVCLVVCRCFVCCGAVDFGGLCAHRYIPGVFEKHSNNVGGAFCFIVCMFVCLIVCLVVSSAIIPSRDLLGKSASCNCIPNDEKGSFERE